MRGRNERGLEPSGAWRSSSSSWSGRSGKFRSGKFMPFSTETHGVLILSESGAIDEDVRDNAHSHSFEVLAYTQYTCQKQYAAAAIAQNISMFDISK